jgi:hypothetical protein
MIGFLGPVVSQSSTRRCSSTASIVRERVFASTCLRLRSGGRPINPINPMNPRGGPLSGTTGLRRSRPAEVSRSGSVGPVGEEVLRKRAWSTRSYRDARSPVRGASSRSRWFPGVLQRRELAARDRLPVPGSCRRMNHRLSICRGRAANVSSVLEAVSWLTYAPVLTMPTLGACMMGSPTLRPLEQWICDTCGEVIDSPSAGYVEWLSGMERGSYRSYRIVHQFAHSPRHLQRCRMLFA